MPPGGINFIIIIIEGLRAYGRRFGGSSKFSVAILPHCQNLRTSLSLIISKMLRGKSPLSSLSPPPYGDIVALFYEKLDIGSQF